MIRFKDPQAQSAFEAELESLMQEEPNMESQERIELAFEITKLGFGDYVALYSKIAYNYILTTTQLWKD